MRGVLALTILIAAGALTGASGGAPGKQGNRLIHNGMIAFGRSQDTPDGGVTNHLYKISSMGGSPQLLVPREDVHDFSASWSPNGSKVAFDRRLQLLDDKVAVANANGTGVHVITDGADPAWSPNGREIAFGSAGFPAVSHIFVIHPDGSGKRQLDSRGIEATAPAWSPDGRRLAFLGGRTSRPRDQIFLVGEDGSSQHQLTNFAAGADAYAWSPDGKLIAFSNGSNRYTKLYLVSSDGRKTRRLLTFSSEAVGIINSIAWSPNGKTISFEGFAGAEADGPESTYIVQPSGRGLKRVRRSENAASWSPDGRELIFRTFYRKSHAFEIVNSRGRLVRWIDISPANDYSPAWQPRR